MQKRFGLKKWELALILSLVITLVYGFLWGETECAAWWGVVYPELTGEAGACPAAAVAEGGVELRFRIAEWIAALLRRLRG